MAEGSIPSRRHRHHGSFRTGSIPNQTARCPRPVSLAEETSETKSFAESRLGRTPYGGSPLRVDHHSHCDGNDSCHRRAHSGSAPARAVDERGWPLYRHFRCLGGDLRTRCMGDRWSTLCRRVLRRVAYRVQPLNRQSVHLLGHHDQAEGSAPPSAVRALGRHHLGPDLSRHLHRGGCRSDQRVQLGVLHFRGLPDLDGCQDLSRLPQTGPGHRRAS